MVKGKVFPVHANKANRGTEVEFHSFLLTALHEFE
jgi:hypothetical protein